MPVVKHPPNPLGLSILAEFYGQYGKDPNFDAIIRYCESLEVNAYNPYHYLKKKEADRVNSVFSDIAIHFGGQIRSVMQGNPVSVHETIHFLDDAVSQALSKAALNRQEKICVHHICDRLRRLVEEFKPPKQNIEYMLDISRHVFDLLRELQCSCCREMLSQPRIMRCGHAFCYHCIKHWFEVSKFTDCPQCRHMEITGNVEKLPHLPVLENIVRTTDHLADIVSKARYNKADKPSRPSCAICAARPAESVARDAASSKERAENTNDLTHSLTERDDKESADRRRQRSSAMSEKLWYDVDLRLFLCTWCFEKQSMRTVDMHHQHPVYIDLLQDVTGESIQFCEKHNYQVKTHWCNSCLTTMCAVCHLLDHGGHCVLHLSPEEALKHAAKEANRAYDFYRLMGEKLKISLHDLMERQSARIAVTLQAYEQLDAKHRTDRGQIWVDSMRRNCNAACEDIEQFLGNFLHKHLEEVRICQSATQIGEGVSGKKLRQRLHVGNTHAKNIPDQMRYCKDFFTGILETFCRTMYICNNVRHLTEEARVGMTQEAVRDRLRSMAKDLTRNVFAQAKKGGKKEREKKRQTEPSGKETANGNADRKMAKDSVQAGGEPDERKQNPESDPHILERNDVATEMTTLNTMETTPIQHIENSPQQDQNITDEQKLLMCQDHTEVDEEAEVNEDKEEVYDDTANRVEFPCDTGDIEHYMIYHTAQSLIASIYEGVVAEEGIIWHPSEEEEHDCSIEHGFSDDDDEPQLRIYEVHEMRDENDVDQDSDDDDKNGATPVKIEYITEEFQDDDEEMNTDLSYLHVEEIEADIEDNHNTWDTLEFEKNKILEFSKNIVEETNKCSNPIEKTLNPGERSEETDAQKPEDEKSNLKDVDMNLDEYEVLEIDEVKDIETCATSKDNGKQTDNTTCSGETMAPVLGEKEVPVKDELLDETPAKENQYIDSKHANEKHMGEPEDVERITETKPEEVHVDAESKPRTAGTGDEAEPKVFEDQNECTQNAQELCKHTQDKDGKNAEEKDQQDQNEGDKEHVDEPPEKEPSKDYVQETLKVERVEEVLGCGDVQDGQVLTSGDKKMKQAASNPCKPSPNKNKKNKRNNRKKTKW